MSFYTHNRPRLVEPELYRRIIRRQIPIKKEPLINYSKCYNMVGGYMKRNWSFILILIILISILFYRYNVIKKDHLMKKARKQYIDQIILNNYRKEKELQEQELQEQQEQQEQLQQLQMYEKMPLNNINIKPRQKMEIENDEIIQETFEEDLSFNNLFNSKLDKTFEPFYGNSSFAPFN